MRLRESERLGGRCEVWERCEVGGGVRLRGK